MNNKIKKVKMEIFKIHILHMYFLKYLNMKK